MKTKRTCEACGKKLRKWAYHCGAYKNLCRLDAEITAMSNGFGVQPICATRRRIK